MCVSVYEHVYASCVWVPIEVKRTSDTLELWLQIVGKCSAWETGINLRSSLITAIALNHRTFKLRTSKEKCYLMTIILLGFYIFFSSFVLFINFYLFFSIIIHKYNIFQSSSSPHSSP